MRAKVIKRDGSLVRFSQAKIEEALKKAFKATKTKYDKSVLRHAIGEILQYDFVVDDSADGACYKPTRETDISVEEIQDILEKTLMVDGYIDVAKEFILYREKHKNMREWAKSKDEFISKYKNSGNTADATIDDNSNVSTKNIGIMNNEIHKPDNILINRYMVENKLKELFPDFDHNMYEKDLSSHIIYKHDESSFAGAVAPYCCSISMYPFLMNGLKKIGGLSAAPKNLDSYCGMYINMVFAIASQFAGAVATSEFLLYFDYFARREWGDDYHTRLNQVVRRREKTQEDITILGQIHQYWQQVIYSINQPVASRGLQAAFVNFSYFDKPFFEAMFGDFYFPDGTQPVWDSLNRLQKEFMMWFNEERLKTILTFPVESFALIYKDGEFADKENADFVAEEYARGHSFFTYISDTADSLSSCCFKGDEVIKIIENGIETSYTLKDFVEKYMPENSESKIDKDIYIDSYTNNGNKEEKIKITGLLKKEYTGEMYVFNINGRTIEVTPDHLLLVRKISDNTIQSIPAKYIYENIDEYEIGIDE